MYLAVPPALGGRGTSTSCVAQHELDAARLRQKSFCRKMNDLRIELKVDWQAGRLQYTNGAEAASRPQAVRASN